MQISQELLAVNFSKGRKGPFPVDTLTIHVTEGTAASVRSWFRNPASSVSSHYMTTRDGGLVQFVREGDTAWCNGRVDNPTAAIVKERPGSNPNNWTISIENEGTGKEDLTPPQRKALLWLMRDIVTRNPKIKVSRRHIIGHKEIYALKSCPGVISVDRLVSELQALPPCP